VRRETSFAGRADSSRLRLLAKRLESIGVPGAIRMTKVELNSRECGMANGVERTSGTSPTLYSSNHRRSGGAPPRGLPSPRNPGPASLAAKLVDRHSQGTLIHAGLAQRDAVSRRQSLKGISILAQGSHRRWIPWVPAPRKSNPEGIV
jgi:hypothetical protein